MRFLQPVILFALFTTSAQALPKLPDTLFRLLLPPDANGNPQALARRTGVQELIWDCGGLPG